MAQKLTFRGVCQGLTDRTLARISFDRVSECDRSSHFLALTRTTKIGSNEDLTGYAAVLIDTGAETRIPDDFSGPRVYYKEDLSLISQDSIMAINPDGHTRIMFRPESLNNTIF